MKRKDIKALHHKSIKELEKELINKIDELRNLKFEKSDKNNKNNRQKRELRDDLARIQTVIRSIKKQEKNYEKA